MKKLNKKLIYFFFLPISLILLFLIIILRPFKKIKICKLPSSRIGHFIGNSEIYLSYKSLFSDNDLILFFFNKPTANNYIEKLVKRKMRLYPEEILYSVYYIFNYLEKKFHFTNFIFNMRIYDRDLDNVLVKTPINLTLKENEKNIGFDFLKKIGIDQNKKFVCLVNRESNYLKQRKINHEYHEIRNSNIQNYKFACEEIIKQGYYVIRVGRCVTPLKFETKNERYFDYANSKYCNSFLDIFLASECHFALGDSDGWIMAPIAFRKPMALVNWVPAGVPYLHSNKLFYLFKHYYDKKNKRNLTLKEIFQKKLAFSLNNDDLKNHFDLVENSPEEIKDLVLEVMAKINDDWKEEKEDPYLQKKFIDVFKKNITNELWSFRTDHKLHNEILGSYSINFLRQNKEWLN